jgi:hypothetical protein
LKHGIYNLGFIAVAPDETGRRFADWWDHRLWDYCLDAPHRGLFTDQRWVDHVPVFFPSVHILRDEGCNVASWNLGERDVFERAGGVWVGEYPLVFWHFSSVDHQAHLDMTERYGRGNVPRRISEQYRTALQAYALEYPPATQWSLAPSRDPRHRLTRALRRAAVDAATSVSSRRLGQAARKLLPRPIRDRIRRALQTADGSSGPGRTGQGPAQ